MKKIIINEQQLKTVTNLLYEAFGTPTSLNKIGSVEVKKNTNVNDIKKLTAKGLNVTLVDEEIGLEQPVKFKHKFEVTKRAILLKIYISRDKTKLIDILDYITSIDDQVKVHQALEDDTTELYVRMTSNGKYAPSGKVTKKTYQSYLNMLKQQASTNKGDNPSEI